MESEEILAEAVRRDQDLESGALEPLSEEAFWAEATREAYSGILEILRLRSRD